MEQTETRYHIGNTLTIAQKNADINLLDFAGKILIKNQTLQYLESTDTPPSLLLNGIPLTNGSCPLSHGDIISFNSTHLTYYTDYILFAGNGENVQSSLPEVHLQTSSDEHFPSYRRSPRTVLNVPDETIEIKNPPAKKDMDKKGLLQIIVSPVVMLCITIAVSILMRRGIYVVISAAGTVISLFMSVMKYLTDKKTYREQNQKREQLYEEYLLNKRKELYSLREQEAQAYRYNYPSVETISQMIHSYSSRIYERSNTDDDFLCVSLGTQTAPASYKIQFNYNEMSMEEDELLSEAARLQTQFCHIYDKPVIVDLKQSNLGLVGSKEAIHEQLKLLAAQITFEQSYHDIELIHIYDEKYEDEFHWLRWYPHCRIHAVNVIGNIHSDAARDQILGSIYRILRERRQKTEENNKVSRYLPHYLFVIDEPKLIMDHAIMEYLGQPRSDLGFSIIYTSHSQANLPENIETVIRLENSDDAVLVLQAGTTKNTRIKLQRAGNVNFEWMARDLSVLKHESGIMAQIPESVTFFDMYQVHEPAELDIKERWQKNNSHKTLAVPLGLRSKDEFIHLNLHEKAHGPHGLVAGTTGSGKSELVQSYILSLAVNFHPYEVAFLLIDYKGGGMANLFQNLPHLVGTITNLDGAQSMRALASIKSELARRQRIFGQHDVNHINDYNKLYKEGQAEEPIPHLFIISDEFAELKKEQPEFMKELVSAARIGRSLGVHLILATQKPSGVVDDQIWTNSKFRLALKVQNESDSKEILHTPDAANITQPGRAYLQVGNNEIYELFQSAWSGAPYHQEQAEAVEDNRIYRLNHLGQRELINSDLSSTSAKKTDRTTQLDATVDYIQELFITIGDAPVRKPWLPPLPDKILSPHLSLPDILSADTPLDTSVTLGLVDIPEQQKQEEFIHDFRENGNLALFGSAGFGKSAALTTLLLSLAVKNSVEKLHFYIVDLGNSALLPLRDLPHTADYIGVDDQEKLNKFIKILENEVKQRKKLLSASGAVNFDMYNRISGTPIPAIIWGLDYYDVLKEINAEYESIVNQISRDGVGLGIYMVITASRPGAVRFNVINNFKNKIALYLIDKMDVNSVVGRTPYPPDEIRGRALIKQEDVHQMQFYLAAEADNLIAYVEHLREFIRAIGALCHGKRPERIPMLPETLELETFRKDLPQDIPLHLIPIGLDVETVKPCFLDLSKGRCLIVGNSKSGKTNLLRVILSLSSPDVQLHLLDSDEAALYTYRSQNNLTYYASVAEIGGFMKEMEDLAETRKQQYEENRQTQPDLLPREFYAKQPLHLILVEDWDHFAGCLSEIKYPAPEKLFADLIRMNVSFVTTTPGSKMKGFDALTKWIKESPYGMLFGPPAEQTIFNVSLRRQESSDPGVGYLIDKGSAVKLLTAKTDT